MTDDSRKRKRQHPFDDMAAVCSPIRGPSQRPRYSLDDSFSVDIDLELSFASNMSLGSPPQSPLVNNFFTAGAPQSPMAMDISPAPQSRQKPQRSVGETAPVFSPMRKRSNTVRAFGRELSNGSSPKTSSSTSFKEQMFQHTTRSPLPGEWLKMEGHLQGRTSFASDAMDIDQSMTMSEEHTNDVHLSSPPPVSRAPKGDFSNLFFDDSSPARVGKKFLEDGASEVNKITSLKYAEYQQSSPSIPQHSSPVQRKYERFASTGGLFGKLVKPVPSGLGVSGTTDNTTDNKRPRRPTVSALSRADTLHKIGTSERIDESEHSVFPLSRRTVSDAASRMLLGSMDDGDVSTDTIPDMSSPAAQVVAKRAMRAARRRDGTDEFKSMGGLSSFVPKQDHSPLVARNSPLRQGYPANANQLLESPSARWLKGAGIPGFGDNEAHGKVLPCHCVPEDGLMRINTKTLSDLIDGKYNDKIISFQVIDCRFDYEYNGGHVPGAININTKTDIERILLGESSERPAPSCSGDPMKKRVLVFHCEFSAKRAPTFAKHLRSKDRSMNNHVYPRIHYPEVYILSGGYCQFFKDFGPRCDPPAYVRMDDPAYLQDRREDLDTFRKAKFGRTRSYAYGDLMSKGPAPAAPSQPRRTTAPTSSGSLSTIFAAGNAARARRSASNEENKIGNLSTLEEGEANTTFGEEDCSFVSNDDVDNSPCPVQMPKGQLGGPGFLNARKLATTGRTLQRSQTFTSCR